MLGCSRKTAEPPAPAPPPPDVSVTAVDSGPTVEQSLRRHAVTDDDFARRVLYTWTTPQQVDALRAHPKLLTATSYQGSGPSRFVLDLEDALKSDPIAKVVLLHPSLARRRYAWPSPFATRMGLAGRGYGDALIRIVLKPGAHLARFAPGEPWSIVDVDGNKVEKLDPEKLAAVFHVRYAKTATAPFREYVVCNEAQIASWSVGTEEIRAEIDAEKALLSSLPAMTMAPAWKTLPSDAPLGAVWHAALAFDNERYEPGAIPAIVTALGTYNPTPPALAHSAM